jgi:hypothetical protein
MIILLLICAVLLVEQKKYFERNTFNRMIKRWNACCSEYTHSLNCLGYRSDCSGFVSYMWKLPTHGGGARTFGVEKDNLKYWGYILKDRTQLKRGDAILVIMLYCSMNGAIIIVTVKCMRCVILMVAVA